MMVAVVTTPTTIVTAFGMSGATAIRLLIQHLWGRRCGAAPGSGGQPRSADFELMTKINAGILLYDWPGVGGLKVRIAGRFCKTMAGDYHQARCGKVSRATSTARDVESAENPVRQAARMGLAGVQQCTPIDRVIGRFLQRRGSLQHPERIGDRMEFARGDR